jgi:tetratricopeptide (TPR) repeat protein
MQQVQPIFNLLSSGQIEAARDLAARLLAEHPREPVLLTMSGIALTALREFDEAIARIRDAIVLRPGVAASHFHLGNALFESGNLESAVDSYRRAAELDANNFDAHNKLCQTLERSNRLEEAATALAQAKQKFGVAPAALALREAELLKRDGDTSAARACLEDSNWRTADADTVEAVAYLLADLCDREGDADAAFAYAEEANQACAAGWAAQRIDRSAYFRLIDEMNDVFRAENVAEWSQPAVRDERQAPTFLVGFPRSGTTLLNTILHSHADVTSLEEQPTVFQLEKAMRDMLGNSLAGIAQLDSDQLATLRNTYHSEVERHVGVQSTESRIVDKLPLNLVQAGLIHRVFPEARFVFAVRHPCDVVLSCYMRALQMNEGMINCLDLENAARLYDRVMVLWQNYQELLPVDVHAVRYESLVRDLEGTISPCLEFLDLDWDDGVRSYAETAKKDPRIVTSSYNQVTRDLYTDASDRWKRYGEQLKPVLPLLMPWAERLGYPG